MRSFLHNPAAAAPGGGVTISEADGTPSGSISFLVMPNGTLSIASSTATYTPAASVVGVAVAEIDGAPSSSGITNLVFPNGTLTVAGATATYTPAAAGGGATLIIAASDQSSTVVGLASHSALQFPIAASAKVAVEALLIHTSAATTTGVNVSLLGPASPTAVYWETESMLTAVAGTDSFQSLQQSTYDTAHTPATHAAGPLTTILTGTIVNGVNSGTVAIRFASEVNASAVAIKAGSWLRYQSA